MKLTTEQIAGLMDEVLQKLSVNYAVDFIDEYNVDDFETDHDKNEFLYYLNLKKQLKDSKPSEQNDLKENLLQTIGKLYIDLYDEKELLRFKKIELARIENDDSILLVDVLKQKSLLSDIKSNIANIKSSLAVLVEEFNNIEED